MAARFRIALLLAPALLVIGVLFSGGLVEAILQSLGYLPAIGRTHLTLAAYREVLGDPAFLRSLALSLYIAVAATALATTLAILAALALRRSRTRFATLVFQFPITVPHLVAAVGMSFLLSQAGLVARLAYALGLISQPDQFPALVHSRYSIAIIATYVWKETPFITLVVLSVLRGMTDELEQVAQTLGANAWQRLRFVVLPGIAPGVMVASLIVFAFCFGAFEVPLLLGRTSPQTLPVMALEKYRSIDLGERPAAMAITVIIAAVTTVITLIYLRVNRNAGGGPPAPPA